MHFHALGLIRTLETCHNDCYVPPVDLCAEVICTAQSQCHEVGNCDSSSGAAVCSSPTKANGEPCDDGDASTTNDVCDGAGNCAGSTTTSTTTSAGTVSV